MKKITAFLIVSVTLLLSNTEIKAQTLTPSGGGVDKCGFNSVHQQMMQNPQFQQEQQNQENHYLAYMNQAIQPKAVVNIPVVIHVMHNGEAVGTTNNPSDAQLISAIDNLNAAFAGTAPFASSAPTNIQFCLAQRDPNNNATTGIVRYNASGITNYSANGCVNNGSSTNNVTQVKAASFWDNTKYYNIWVVTKINGSNGAGTQGYAQFAGTGGYSPSDGTVILGNTMGYDPNGSLGYNLKSYTRRNGTLIHELGHAFNLYHTFEGDGNGANCPSETNCNTQNDRVCDTPPHVQSASDCPADNTPNPCQSGTTAGQFIHNFMDYSSEVCAYLFTPGQATRMNATVVSGGGRYSLTQSNGCDPVNNNDAGIFAILDPPSNYCITTVAPKVTIKNFGSGTITNLTIRYQIDGGALTSFAWSGSLANSATENVTLSSTTVSTGSHTLKVFTELPNGMADENMNNDTMTLSFSVNTASLPFLEQFEAGTAYPPTDWSRSQSPAHGFQWSQYTGAHANGTSTGISALIVNNSALSGYLDNLITEPISLEGVNTPRLTFKVASKYFSFGGSTDYFDTLRIFVSTDCGATYNAPIYVKGGPSLATMGQGNSAPGSYQPTMASHYRTDTVDLSAYNGASIVLKFQHADYGGQNFFLDDINVQDPCQAFGDPTAITGETSVCEDSTGLIYSISAVSEATGYVWSVPSDATITSGHGTTSITVNFGSVTDSIKVYATSANCGNSDTSFVEVTIQPKPGNAGAIVGDVQGCAGDTKTYSIPTVSDATGYTWEVPSGTTIQSGNNTNSITVVIGSASGDIKVTPTNACGAGTSSTLSLNVTPEPVLSGTISGPTDVCPNAAGQIYSVTADPNATDYVWTVPTDASINGPSNGSSITVDFGIQSGNITVQSQNACGQSSPLALSINVNSIPSIPDSIVGNREVCNGQTGIAYSVFIPVSGITYTWTVPAGSSMVAGASSDQITVDFGSTSGNITVKAGSSCGQSLEKIAAIAVRDIPVMPGIIAVQDTVCKNESGVSASVASVPDADTYTWTIPAGAILATGSGTNAITIDFASQGGNIEVFASNLCGDSPTRTKNIVMDSIPVSPASISGPQNVCATSTSESYSIAAIANATNYTWTVPPSASLLQPNGTTSMSVNWNGTSGSIMVTASNLCGTSAPKNLSVNVQPVTPVPDSIVGDRRVCQNESNVVYKILTPDAGTTYSWTIPAGSTLISQNNDSIVLSFVSTGGTLSVTADNGCGASNATSALIEVHTLPATPGIISTSNTVCENQMGVPASVAAVPDADSYTWTVMSGATLATGQGSNAITYNAGNTSGSVSVVASNECGTSAASTLNVTIKNIPSAVPVIKGPTEVCISSTSEIYNVVAIPNATSYTWSVLGGGSITSGQGTQTVDVNWAGNSGQIKVAGQNVCGQSPEAVLNVTIVTITSPTDSVSGDTLVCPNENNILYQVVTPQPGTSYTWTLPNGATLVSGAGNALIQMNFGTNPGNITVTADNGCGASTPRSLVVQMDALPISAGTITGPNELCQNTSDVFSVANNPDIVDYQWTAPNGSVINGGQGTNTINMTLGTQTGTIQLIPVYICGNGPASTFSITSRSFPATPATISGDSEVCQSETGVPYTVVSDTNVTNYSWSANNGATVAAGNGSNAITVDFGTQDVIVSVTPTNICGSGVAKDMAIVANDPNELATIHGLDTVCALTEGVLYYATGISGTLSYAWMIPSDATLISGAGTDSIVVDFGSNPGSIQVAIDNSCGSFNASKVINFGQTFTGNTAGIDTAICETNAFTLAGGAISPSNNYVYAWEVSTNQNGPFNAAPGVNNQASFSSQALSSGNTIYLRRIASLYGCSDTSQAMEIVFEGVPALLSTNLDTTLCSNDQLQVPNLFVQNGVISSWTHDGVGQLINPNSATPTYQIASADESTIVTLTMTIQSNNSCSPATITEDFILLVNPNPVATGSGYEELCPTGLSVPITGYSGSVSNVHWIQSGNGSFTDGTTFSPTYHTSMDDAGDSIVLQMIVTTDQCATPLTDTVDYLIYLYPSIYDTALVVNAGADTLIYTGDKVVLNGTAPDAIYTIWTPGSLVEDSLDLFTFATLDESKELVLTAYSMQGCINRDTIYVEVRDLDTSIFVPNLFTPNNDGMNDTWLIPDLLTVSDVKVMVFNREGELVFEQADYQHNWDGTMNGKKLPPATYYYIIDVPGMDQPLKGVVSILQQ